MGRYGVPMKIFFAFAVATFLAACGSTPCDELKKQCDACPKGKDGCMVVVNLASQQACQQSIDSGTFSDPNSINCKDPAR